MEATLAIFNDVKELVFKNKGIIFGGFVRDEIIRSLTTKKITPNDMDVYFENSKMASEFIEDLETIANVSIQIINSSRYTGFFSLVKYRKVILDVDDINISIDVLFPYLNTEITCASMEPPFNNLDFTCNGFLEDINGIRYSKYTGMEMDFLSDKKRDVEIQKIKKDMIAGITELTNVSALKIEEPYVVGRILKMINRKNHWKIRNIPFNLKINKKDCEKECEYCCQQFKKNEKTIQIFKETYHRTCFFEDLNHQVIQKSFNFSTIMGTILNFI